MCFLSQLKGVPDLTIYCNKSLKDFCTFKIGGKAKYIVVAGSVAGLIEAAKVCKTYKIKAKVIGFGSNLLFDDRGFDGAILVNRSNKVRCVGECVYADSGVGLARLLNCCWRHRLSGLESLAGIPASVGGAVCNNAGAFGCEVSDCVEYVEVRDIEALDRVKHLSRAECNFSYRNSIFKSDKGKQYIITRVKFRLKSDNAEAILAKMCATLSEKQKTQPVSAPSAGSVFKRGDLIPAKVIDSLGLKGTKINGAEVSTLHAGFIINTGNACAADVLNLIALINQKVNEQHHSTLSLEIEFVHF